MSPNHAKIALFCPSLGLGGSEQQLVNLAIGLHERGYDVHVLVLYGGAPLENTLARAGVRVVNLEKKTTLGGIAAALKLRSHLRRERVDVIYSFHGLPNVLTAMMRLFDRRVKIVVGVRGTWLDVSQRAWWQRFAYWIEPRLSAYADLVIVNSHAGHGVAEQRGFPISKLRVVLNGIDVRRFFPDEEVGSQIRRDLRIDASLRVVGLVARIDPVKGHWVFLNAAALVKTRRPDVRFLCVWDGDLREQQRLAELTRQLGLHGTLIWAPGDRDIHGFYNAMDVAVSSSYSEGFSNTIAEAMACGCRCVVTDVGDSARLVEDLGIVVPAGDASRLADGILAALAGAHGNERPAMARERIVARYSIDAMVNSTLECLLPLLGNGMTQHQIDCES